MVCKTTPPDTIREVKFNVAPIGDPTSTSHSKKLMREERQELFSRLFRSFTESDMGRDSLAISPDLLTQLVPSGALVASCHPPVNFDAAKATIGKADRFTEKAFHTREAKNVSQFVDGFDVF